MANSGNPSAALPPPNRRWASCRGSKLGYGVRSSTSTKAAFGRTRLAEARIAVNRREAELESAFTPDQRKMIRDWLDGVAVACR